DDANNHLDKFLHVTQSIKVNGVTNDALRLYFFPHSLTHHATAGFDCLPRNSINTFEQMAKMFLEKYFPPSMVTKLRNEITNFLQRLDESLFEAWERGTFMKRRPKECYDLIENMTAHHNDWDTSAQREIAALKAEMAEINKNLMRVLQVNQQVKAVTRNYETCGGPHSFSDCPATVGQTQNVYTAGAYQGNSYQSQGNRNLLSYCSDNYLGPPCFNQNQNRNNQNHNFQNQNRNQGNHHPQRNNQGRNQFFQGANQGQNQPPAYQAPAYQAPVYQAPVHQPQIPQPQVVTTNEFTNFIKANDAILKNMQPNMTSLTKSNLELKTCLEDLKGITTRSGTAYPGPTIPTTYSYLVVERETEETKNTVHPTNNGSTEDVQPPVVPTESLILNSEPVISPIIELVASPNKLSLPDLSPTCMTLELADRSISHPVGVAEDVFIKVGTFHFLDDFVVVDFDADPRVPLIIGRSFLKTGRALIDVFEGELTLCVGKKAITFNLDQTSRYSANYNDMKANRIDVIDMDCVEYSQKFLVFPIDFILEEVDVFLALEDDPTSLEVDQSYVDTEGDILLLEAFLNDDPSLPPPNQENYVPEVLKELKICDDKLPVIIAKDLSVEEKTALITVLKSHKRAIAWKLSDINGIDLEFCTHKILMEEDFEPAVQHHRRVNPKIYDVIKQEVLKLLDAGLIYPIYDSPWVSPIHCVPKKGGFTVVENEENELIPTRLVTGWHVCIDYRKLNEATRKDHFPLPFMDQILERLAGNTIVFSTVSLVISKFPSIQKIRRKPHSPVHTEHFLTAACLLDCAMHQARFRGV
nr:reverse transcriptase domain-containing protein [Tanacetum cinerariifolium]